MIPSKFNDRALVLFYTWITPGTEDRMWLLMLERGSRALLTLGPRRPLIADIYL